MRLSACLWGASLLGMAPALAFADDAAGSSASSGASANAPASAPAGAPAGAMVAANDPAAAAKPATPAPPPPPPPVWSGDFSAGFVRSSGNASASTLTLKADLDYKRNAWENLTTASAFKAASNGENTDEKYSLGDKLLYNFDPDEYVFGKLDYDYDHYGPYVQRYSTAVGYGRHVLKTPTQTLDLDAGAGVDHTREQGAGDFQTEAIGTFDGTYIWKIAPNSQFKQTLRTEFAKNNTYLDPISELKLTIIKNFFASIDYELRYNTHTPAGTYHTDQITSINVGYAFGKPSTTAAP